MLEQSVRVSRVRVVRTRANTLRRPVAEVEVGPRQTDADWGHGATVASEQGYSWADATVDSVKTVESYFNPAVATYVTASDIVSY